MPSPGIPWAGAACRDDDQATTRRKKEGAFHTPAFITRYNVGQALGGVWKVRFEALRTQHEAGATGPARKALTDPNAYDLNALNEPQRKSLIRFWEAWQEELKNLRILDPACGSGAFLIEAFDQLHALYEISNARLEELRGQRTLFDLDRQILQHNLYGVDLNAEAIQICQLSLWIKTAARGKVLTSLDHTIREGNSVINDPAVHPKAFNWQAAFPEVFAQGGFDVVVGNPRYVRQELLSPVGFLMEDLPIAEPIAAIREAAEKAVHRLIEITARQQQTQRTLLDWLRVEYAIEKPGNKLQAVAGLDSDTLVTEVKRILGKKLPLTAAGVQGLREEYARTIEPARARAVETLKLECALSDIVNQAYGLTPEEIELMWKTAPPRMPIPQPA